MYCSNCGKQIDDRAIACPYCGVATANYTANNYNKINKTNSVAIIGFIFSFFISIVGLICSAVGYSKANELDGKGKGLAIAGIIISIIAIILSIVLPVALII